MDIKAKLALLEELFEVDEGTLEADLILECFDKWDSMNKLALIVLMDDEFNKQLNGEQINKFRSIKDILTYMD